MINAYGMTAAMTYDTATQHDGMHIAGPPMTLSLLWFKEQKEPATFVKSIFV